uniref:Uncharacterized protein n=1 Tax=Panagrolaimus davidi TaxID=227884 RepID=A0A914PRV8_9BILA
MKGEVKLNGILGAPNRPPLTPEVISTMQLLIRKNNCDPFVSAATELGDDTFYDAETFRSRLATKKVAIRIAKLLNPVLKGFLVIRDVFVDEVKNYKRLEEDNYGYQYNSKVLTGTENYVYVKKCLDIIEKHNLLTRVLIKNEYQIEFQKAVNTLTLIIRDVIALPDHWISMEKEASENPFKRVGGFSIIDNKENDYLNLAKVIQPAIESIGMSDDVILSYKYLELLPKNLLLDLEDVKKLKDVFGELRKTEYSITVAENGNIGYGCIQLPVGKWLDVTTPKYLTEVVAYFTEVNMNNSMQPFILQCSGLISPFDSAETTNLEFSNQVTETQIQLKEVIEKFSSELKSNNSKLSLTINSARHIMFGTYLWVPFNVIEGIKDHIIKIVTAFEKTFEKTDGQDQGLCALNSEEASMQSIENLETQYLALMLARKLNVVLHRDLDAFMSDGTLKIIRSIRGK